MTARTKVFEKPALGKVLLAEDDELIGQATQKGLQHREINCDWFKTFDEAAKALKMGNYHAVLADVYLSKTADGLELISMAKDGGIPSIILTAALDLEIAKKGLNLGADFLIEKPFEIDTLAEKIEDLWENPRGLISRRERFFDLHQLTEKEKELCRLILKGLTNQEIGDVVGTTIGTVKFYSSQIFEKFEVKNRSELFNLIFPT